MNTSNNKTIIYGIIAVIIIAGLVYGLSKRNAVEDIDPGDYSLTDLQKISEAERKAELEKRLGEYQAEVSALPADASSGDKYSAYIPLAEVQVELEQYDAALDSLNAIPEDRRSGKRVYFAYAQIYRAKGDIELAKSNVRLALDADQNDVRIWLFNLDLNQDLPTVQLDSLYRQAIPATKSNLEIMISYARFSERVGNIDTAVAAWETAVNVNPEKEDEYRAEIARLRQ